MNNNSAFDTERYLIRSMLPHKNKELFCNMSSGVTTRWLCSKNNCYYECELYTTGVLFIIVDENKNRYEKMHFYDDNKDEEIINFFNDVWFPGALENYKIAQTKT